MLTSVDETETRIEYQQVEILLTLEISLPNAPSDELMILLVNAGMLFVFFLDFSFNF